MSEDLKNDSYYVDVNAIKNWFKRYLTAVREGDIETYLASWSDDVIFLPPNQRALVGKDSIRVIAEGIERNAVEAYVLEQEIGASGNLAYSRNLVHERFTPRDGGEPYSMDFKSIFMFRRMDDGQWLGSHCIWNTQ